MIVALSRVGPMASCSFSLFSYFLVFLRMTGVLKSAKGKTERVRLGSGVSCSEILLFTTPLENLLLIYLFTKKKKKGGGGRYLGR